MARRVEATERDDIVIGGLEDDTVDCLGGSDIIDGGGHGDVLEGGGGRDFVLGGSGDDTIGGGDDADVLSGGSGDDILVGEDGHDFIRAGTGADLVVGEDGRDSLWGGAGNDTLRGGAGNDILVGGAGDDVMNGGEGRDSLVYFGETGDDIVKHFEVDQDVIDLRLLNEAVAFSDLSIVDMEDGSGVRITHRALDGSIELRGIAAADLSAANFAMPDGATTSIVIDGMTIYHPIDPFIGSDGSSTMMDGAGDTRILARGGSDHVFGGEGDDRMEGGTGDDHVFGEEGDDTVEGGIGHDRLLGGEGDDRLDGGTGNDWLHGGEGDDALVGGAGADVFAFGATGGTDRIVDFADGEDRIDLSALPGTTGFRDLEIASYAGQTLIDLTCYGGGWVRVDGASVEDFDALDFVFHEPAAIEPTLDGM